jgi:hypothetical protein
LVDEAEQVIDRERLRQVRSRADLRRAPRVVLRRRQHDHRRPRPPPRPVAPNELPPVHDRHLHVEQDHIRPHLVEDREGCRAVGDAADLVARVIEDQLEHLPHGRVVLDHE